MSGSRLDDLLVLALEGGELPPDTTAEERAEIARLVQSGALLRRGRAELGEELKTAMPVARARFERFLDAETRPAPVLPRGPRPDRTPRRLSPWGPAVALPGAAAVGGPLLVLGALALVALIVFNSTFRDVEVAVALSEGDYVQVEGVVRETRSDDGGLDVVVETGAGRFPVSVAADARIQRDGVAADPSALTPGTVVVVDGLVGPGKDVVAGNVLIGSHTPAGLVPLRRPPNPRIPLEGVIVMFRMAADGEVGEVVLEVPGEGRVIVPVDGVSVQALLRHFATALGERIIVSPVPGTKLFRIDLPADADDLEPPPPPAGRPALVYVRGVILEATRQGLLIATADGRLSVIAGANTRRFAKAAGLSAEGLADPTNLRGHVVILVGHPGPERGQFFATVAIIRPEVRLPER